METYLNARFGSACDQIWNLLHSGGRHMENGADPRRSRSRPLLAAQRKATGTHGWWYPAAAVVAASHVERCVGLALSHSEPPRSIRASLALDELGLAT